MIYEWSVVRSVSGGLHDQVAHRPCDENIVPLMANNSSRQRAGLVKPGNTVFRAVEIIGPRGAQTLGSVLKGQQLSLLGCDLVQWCSGRFSDTTHSIEEKYFILIYANKKILRYKF